MTQTPGDLSTHWQQCLDAGIEAFNAGRSKEAIRQLETAARARPNDAGINYWLANAYRQAGDTERAEAVFRRLLEEHQPSEHSVFGLAFLLREQGRLEEAGKAMRLLHQQPDRPVESLLRIAGFLRDINRFEDAIEVMQQVVQRSPGDAASRLRLARLLQAMGRFGEAIEQSRQALDLDRELGGAWLTLTQLQKFTTADHPDLARLRAAGRMLRSEEARMCHGFALAKAHDDLGDFDAAWQACSEANERATRAFPWDRDAWNALVERKLSSEPAGPHATPGTTGTAQAVYIVGMLRSGTTLLEQRLGKHAAVRLRGEQNFLAHIDQQDLPLATAREQLWTHLRQGDAAGRLFIDKNPLNFRYLDTLYRLIPGARVIHVLRDGRNSCLSCYAQLFQHADAAFANRLEDLTAVYHDYRRLMAHWKKRWPDRVLEVRYEDLVTDTQATLETVLDFLGLAAEQSTEVLTDESAPVRTASAWQARQAIYRDSLQRWKNYQDFAPAFFDGIAAIDAKFAGE
jgi:tetratricopeptide (TPR) repeat protein